jgi:Cobalamin-independent synthase, Catalytic domain
VAERLREIAEQVAGLRVDLLGEQADVVATARGLHDGRDAVAAALAAGSAAGPADRNHRVRTRLDALGPGVLRALGPGMYDVHSPQVPDATPIRILILAAQQWVEPSRLWVNPDCGLKTRGEAETVATLDNLVAAAHAARIQ